MTARADTGEPALRFEGIRKVFPPLGPKQQPVVALDHLSEVVRDGEFVVVVGPSGCGKSTLLEIAAGLQRPSAGEVYLHGRPVRGPSPALGMVFQEDSLFPWRTALQNMEFGLEAQGVARRERRARCQELLQLVGLGGFGDSYPRQLSGGMRQRVAIGRALASDPEVLLMDEPFGALDQQTRYFLGGELLRIWERTRKTVFFVTHDISEAVLLGDRIWVLSGRPSVLAQHLEIDLPRPRGVDTLSMPRFHELTSAVWATLANDARATMTAGAESSR